MMADVGRTTSGPAWIVYTRPFHGDPRGDVLRGLTTNDEVHLASTFAGMELYRMEPTAVSRTRS
jgi:hypothetical protein